MSGNGIDYSSMAGATNHGTGQSQPQVKQEQQ